MASKLKIKVNGLVHNVTASLDTPLLYVLHNELHLHGPRFGCGLAQCGACSVLLDGKEIRSCVTPVAAVSGKAITTLEGMPALYAKSRGTTAVGAGVAASAAAGVDRRAGSALRVLPERDDDPGRRSAGDHEAPDRGADPHRDERPSLPLRDLSADPDRDPEGRRCDGEGWEVAMTEMLNKEFSRKTFVKGAGGLVVGFSLAGAATANAATTSPSPNTQYPPTNQVDSFIEINPDNTANLFTSQVEIGNGTPTGFLMIAAEELDMSMAQMTYGSTVKDKNGVIIGTVTDGWRAVNTGGHGGSNAIASVGQQVRAAAAYARQALNNLAADEPRRSGGEPHREGRRRLGRRQDRHLRPARRRQAAERDDRDDVAAAGRRHLEAGRATTSSSARASRASTSRARSPATTRTRTRSGSRACSTAAGCARAARGRGSPTASPSR